MRCAIYIYVLLTYLLTGYEQYENGTVRIDSVSLRDSGIYVCVAQNSAGTAMAQVRLQVQGFIYLLTHLLFPSSVNWTIDWSTAVASQKMPSSAKFRKKIWTYSSSRSSKVDDFGTNRKRICEFLLVINSNFGSNLALLLRYGDLLAENCVFFLPLSYLAPRSLSSLWNCRVKLSVRKLESWSYSVVKVAWS